MRTLFIVTMTALLGLTLPAFAKCSPSEGDAYAAKGSTTLAVQKYSRVLKRAGCKNNPRIIFQRARVHFATGNFPLAARDFAKVVLLRPSWSKAQGGLAWSLYQTGESLEKAFAAAKRAAALDPSDHHAWHTMGIIGLKIKKPVYTTAHALREAWYLDPKRTKGYWELVKINGLPDYSSRA